MTNRILTPVALTILFAATGCAVDKDDAPAPGDNDTQNVFVAADESIESSGVQFEAAEGSWAADTNGGITSRSKPKTNQPGPEAPEGQGEKGQPENEAPEAEEPGDETEPTKPFDPNAASPLAPEEVSRIADMAQFLIPARMHESVDSTTFVNLDFAGSLTTRIQDLGSCSAVELGEGSSFSISYECDDRGDNAPNGTVNCEAVAPAEGETVFDCDWILTSTLGENAGSMTITHKHNTGSSTIALNGSAPQSGSKHGLTYSANYTVSGAAADAGQSAHITQSGSMTLSTDQGLFVAHMTNLQRTGFESCIPESGSAMTDVFLNSSSGESELHHMSLVDGDWRIEDQAGDVVSVPLCK